MRETVPGINPKLLVWARERAGYSLAEVAQAIKKDPATIESWESGASAPTYAQLETLAYKVYKRPLALFFFPEPPVEVSKRVSVAEASLHLPELLHEVQEEGTTFIIVEGDKEVGQLTPVAQPVPLDEFIKVLQEFVGKDPEFADDLEEIRAQQHLLGGPS